jgi:hypothetical protein
MSTDSDVITEADVDINGLDFSDYELDDPEAERQDRCCEGGREKQMGCPPHGAAASHDAHDQRAQFRARGHGGDRGNAALMVAGMLVDGHEAAFKKMDLAVLWFFAAELSVRLAMARLGFFHSLWNTVDLVVVVVALLPVVDGAIAVLRLARLARSAHLLRHVAHLRLARLTRHRYHMLRGRRHAGQMQLPRRDGGRRFTS